MIIKWNRIIFCVFYFSLLLSARYVRWPSNIAESNSVYKNLTPITQFVKTSAQNDVDQGNFRTLDSFLSKNFSTSNHIDFHTIGTDQPGQPLRGHPFDVVVSRDGGKLYASLPGNEAEPLNIIAVLNPDTGKLLKTINVGLAPFGLYLHPKVDLIFVTHLYSDYISIISTKTDTEIARLPLRTPSGSRFYAQKIAWTRDEDQLLITNRMTDSLLVYKFLNLASEFKFIKEIPLSVTNSPIKIGKTAYTNSSFSSNNNNVEYPAINGLTANSNPSELRRTLRNINPRDIVIFEDVWITPTNRTNIAYIGNINGLGVSIVDVAAGKQIGSIDLNSPAMGLAKYESANSTRRLLFIATGSQLGTSMNDASSGLGVVSVDENPFDLTTRFASSGLPALGPSGGPGTATLVPPGGTAPYLSAFASQTSSITNFPLVPEESFPKLLNGALPFQLEVGSGFLAITYSASDQVELFSINPDTTVPSDILVSKGIRFTNSDQVAFPTSRLQSLISNKFNSNGLLEYSIYSNGSRVSPTIEKATPITGEQEPRFFDGRCPAGIVIHPFTRRIYVANRLGETISVFEFSPDGVLTPARISIIDLRSAVSSFNTPRFPATLAELGEDFYTSSRIMLSRKFSCNFCHPDSNTDSKSWVVNTSPVSSYRKTLTNRNLRDTAPYGISGDRSNLEVCARNLRLCSPDNFFGGLLDKQNHAFRDADGDGIKTDSDRGRPQADINRDAMYVLERTGIGFEYVTAAIAAFLEAEPRLFPNPFLQADKSLSETVSVNINDDSIITGNAKRGEQIFTDLGCVQCHASPLYTNNRVFTRFSQNNETNFKLIDLSNSGILDGVVLSHEESFFGLGSSSGLIDIRLLPPIERNMRIPGTKAYPTERSLENVIDSDSRVFYSNSYNTFTFLYNFPSVIPRSLFSINKRVLAGEPGFLFDKDVNLTGADSRNLNIPSLRNIWDTAPYLHHGRAATLMDVITEEAEFNYRRNPNTGEIIGGPFQRHGKIEKLKGNEQDKIDLVAFLMSIE